MLTSLDVTLAAKGIDHVDLMAAFASPEAAEAARQLMTFAKGLVTMYTAEVVDETGKPA